MDNIRIGDAWRVTLQTADASGNAQAPDAAILAGDVRVYVNGMLSGTAATVTTLADIVGGHLISWPNTTADRGSHLRMQVAFTVDAIDYEARFEAIIEINPLAEDVTGIFALNSLATLLTGISYSADGAKLSADTASARTAASAIRTAIGLASANLTTALDAITGTSATAATQATAAALDASKIPRLPNPIAAGASAIETWIVTVDSRGTLISTKAYS